MDKLTTIKIFVRVAELRSFTQCALDLGVTKATVSNAIQQLESHVGLRLLNRTTRMVDLTDEGKTYYARAKNLLNEIDELDDLFKQNHSDIKGSVRIDMPTGTAKNLIIPHLSALLNDYPNLTIELSSTDRYVDVIREGFDCVIRAGKIDNSSLVAKKLGELKIITCASKAYIETYGNPLKLVDLNGHQGIGYAANLGDMPGEFTFIDEKNHHITQLIPHRIVVNNAENYLQCCLHGLGMIQTPMPAVKPYLDNGMLMEVLPQYRVESIPIYLIYPYRQYQPKRVRVLIAWISELIKNYLA